MRVVLPTPGRWSLTLRATPLMEIWYWGLADGILASLWRPGTSAGGGSQADLLWTADSGGWRGLVFSTDGSPAVAAGPSLPLEGAMASVASRLRLSPSGRVVRAALAAFPSPDDPGALWAVLSVMSS